MLSIFRKKSPDIKKPSMAIVEIPQSMLSIRSEIDPQHIVSAKMMVRRGHLKNLLRVYRLFKQEDDSVASACDVRQEALRAANITFSTEGLSRTQVDYFNALIKRFSADYCNMLLDLKFTGVLFRQIEYEFEGGRYTPVRYQEYPNANLRLIDDVPVPYKDDKPMSLNPAQFISMWRDDQAFYSILRYHVFQFFAINNWAQFTETYGKPPRIAKYRPGTTDAEKETLWNMLKNFGTDLAAMVSDNITIDFADYMNKQASSDLYQNLCEFCDARITGRILGNTLTTKAVDTGGSYAQAKVHELVREDILSGDCRDLDAFLTEHFTMLNRLNFGGGEIDVIVQPKVEINLLERIQVDNILWNNIGLKFPIDYWYNTYRVPFPEDGPGYYDGYTPIPEKEPEKKEDKE